MIVAATNTSIIDEDEDDDGDENPTWPRRVAAAS
jgi:hypothetical protein